MGVMKNEVLLELMKLRAIYSLKHDSSATEALDYVIFKLNPPKKQTENKDRFDARLFEMIIDMCRFRGNDFSSTWSQYFNKYSLRTLVHAACEDPDNFTVYDLGINRLSNAMLCTPKSYEECKDEAKNILQEIIIKFINHDYKDYIEIECEAINLRIDNLVDICEAIPVDAAGVVAFRPGFRVYDDYCDALKICNAYLYWKSKEVDIDGD